MATRLKRMRIETLFVGLLFLRGVSFAENIVGLELKCGEVQMRVTVKRRFVEERLVPFKPEHVRLGRNATQRRSCAPQPPVSASEMVIRAGLRECGTEARVNGEWLVYSNHLVLVPAVVATSTGSVIANGSPTVIPVECHYKRRQTASGQPLTPTWLPMTSTISGFGLLHFSLRAMEDDCASLRSSVVYQQGEAVFLEASVDAPLHPPLALYVAYCVATLRSDPLSLPSYRFISKHGCLMDSVLPGSSSTFFPRERDNRLCFSVQAFHFNQEPGGQMFISCHLRATLKEDTHDHLDKACVFNRTTFSWHPMEGDTGLCECCDSEDCFRRPEQKLGHAGLTPQPETENKHETVATVGPLHTLPRFHRTGQLLFSR